MSKIDAIIEGVIDREGGYSNNAADRGGETMYGITKATARRNGYGGEMRALPREVAKAIYMREYVTQPGFGAIIPLSEGVAAELVDTGVNMGPSVPARFLQMALNGLNNGGKLYKDIVEDADVGPATVGALAAYLKKRGKEGETVMLTALNCMQGARYIELARTRTANATFLYGWLRTRVKL